MELIIVSLRFCLDTVEMKNGPWSFAGICPGTNVSKPKKGSAAAVFGLGIVSLTVTNKCRLGNLLGIRVIRNIFPPINLS
ncbi:hypothetical protein C5167_008624 [Papaver somniferum]|uniref:Uncharacterized protein n=1 Tax=Papaver somniferum TaxID=3469 RepID=A0A4Y7JY11_PAPSO|nr:hypothetical protein C5167_008624 [Papaver somniferum]